MTKKYIIMVTVMLVLGTIIGSFIFNGKLAFAEEGDDYTYDAFTFDENADIPNFNGLNVAGKYKVDAKMAEKSEIDKFSGNLTNETGTKKFK